MAHEERELVVLIKGSVAGRLILSDGGQMEFSYDSSYDGCPLSYAMRDKGTTYKGRCVQAWFAGVLPDKLEVRQGMAMTAGHGYGANSYFGLLSDYGKDLPGAVQVVRPNDLEDTLAEVGAYEPISEDKIEERLRKIIEQEGNGEPRVWALGDEHWSLAGNQAKLALMRDAEGYHTCLGAAPSNVIVKPGVSTLAYEALDECITMNLLQQIGIPVSKTEMAQFGDMPCIVIERYDRVPNSDGLRAWERIHQEDLCQATATMPKKKYTEDGGPSARDLLRLLDLATSQRSKERFVDALILSYLIGGTDAHAKNYSIVYDNDSSFFLAPLYDVASVLPYVIPHERYKVAMMVGREPYVGGLRGTTISRFAKSNGLSTDGLKQRTVELAEQVIDALPKTLDMFSRWPHSEELADSMLPRMTALCRAAIQNINSSRRTTYIPELASMGHTLPRPGESTTMEKRVWVSGFKRGETDVKGYWRRRRESGERRENRENE